jgi:DNA-binding response OmpR family regulator
LCSVGKGSGEALVTTSPLLIVEDQPAIQMLLEDIFEGAGFAVRVAGNGAEALAVLEDDELKLAGLITDIRLGTGLTGWDIARQARERRPDLPVIYITGFSEESWTARGVPNSVLVPKPFTPASILTAVRGLLQ